MRDHRLMLGVCVVFLWGCIIGAECAAHADTHVLPAGTEVTTPDGDTTTLIGTWFLIDRDTVDECRSCFTAEAQLTDMLLDCVGELEKVGEKPSQPSRLLWFAVGAGTAAAVSTAMLWSFR